ncbi:hypothetical protein CPC08DRAFT_823958 [Agrocybe pediades]|nr:hypothetical protein CPC08DRAFT_823958 [Agrocybe pediades]
MSRKSMKSLRNVLDRAKTVISMGTTSASTSALQKPDRLPFKMPKLKEEDIKPEEGDANKNDDAAGTSTAGFDTEGEKSTQTSETLNEFLEERKHLLNQMFRHSYDNSVGKACDCHAEGATKTTRCYDCPYYPISCSDCYITAHKTLPHHWAEVWQSEMGYFRRHDIGTLQDDIAAINLGHEGKPCLSKYASNVNFILVALNGIHATKIRFCQCRGEKRWEQLMESRLFPSTMTQPTSAFMFDVLHQYHLQHLASKASAHDFAASLRMLTDNVDYFKVPDMAHQLRMVMRIWRLLVATKRLGQGHNISSKLPHQREFIVHCPSCIDPYLNAEQGWEDTSKEYRHLNQTQFTADGNHHSNRYLKNTDPDDISLFEGKAYFPEDSEYQKYIKRLPQNTKEKVPCEHLKAISALNRKKFKNMDITGIVNIQCSHVFIKSMVDLQLGEKFANTDYAFSHAIQNTTLGRSKGILIDSDEKFALRCAHLFSYDISCGYSDHAAERFRENFPNEASFLDNTDWLIPLVHVQNHRDNRTYPFSQYKECAGHFQGETAEQPWIELN